MTTVVEELQSVTKVLARPGDTPEEFAQRLARKANDLTDDKWEALEGETQQWANKAIEALRKKRPVPLPAGIEELFPDAENEEEVPEEVPQPTKKTIAKAVTKASKTTPATAEKGVGRNTSGRKGKFSTEAVIKMLAKANPYREVSKAHGVFSKYKDGMTVSEAIEAGIGRAYIRWDLSHGHIELSDPVD